MNPRGEKHSAAQAADVSSPSQGRRVVVVGDQTLADRLSRDAALADVLGAGPLCCVAVPSYLSALGEVAQGGADAVIGPAAAMPGSAESVARGLRAVSPGIRLVALCDPNDMTQGRVAVTAGFDRYIVEPADPPTASERIDSRSGTGRATGNGSHRSDPDTRLDQAPAPSGTGLTDNLCDSSPEVSPDAPPDGESLGDIDLVESLLAGGESLREMAVRIIRANSGMTGVGLGPVDGQVPEGDVSLAVNFRGRCFGQLHAPPPTTEEQLAGWAAWLGRWLALRSQVSDLRTMALRDELTGIWNRRYFNRFLQRILKRAQDDRSQVTLLVFDIDDFKAYNDLHGHATGDEVLRETARLMQSVVREHDVVARIGGDEFAVIFWDSEQPRKPNSEHPKDVVAAARRFQDAICAHRFPKLLDKAIGRLTISGGLASFPWDGRTPDELMARADAMAIQSKRQGKNAITFGTGAKRDCTGDG